jgi:hypothetical protein
MGCKVPQFPPQGAIKPEPPPAPPLPHESAADYRKRTGKATRFQGGDIVHWSQQNGIVCFGLVLGTVQWGPSGKLGGAAWLVEGPPTHYVVRYIFDPDGDPPRKPYTMLLIDDENQPIHSGFPKGFGWEKLRPESLVLAGP